MHAHEQPPEKSEPHRVQLDPCAVDLSQRGLAFFALEDAVLAPTISHGGKYTEEHETNPAFHSAWANYMEC